RRTAARRRRCRRTRGHFTGAPQRFDHPFSGECLFRRSRTFADRTGHQPCPDHERPEISGRVDGRAGYGSQRPADGQDRPQYVAWAGIRQRRRRDAPSRAGFMRFAPVSAYAWYGRKFERCNGWLGGIVRGVAGAWMARVGTCLTITEETVLIACIIS